MLILQSLFFLAAVAPSFSGPVDSPRNPSAAPADRTFPGNSVDGCGERKGCLTHPPNCLGKGTCWAVVSYAVDASTGCTADLVQMELWRKLEKPGNEYVAVGFAPDAPMMIGAGVVACILLGTKVDVVASYNPARYNIPVDNARANITVTKASVDGQSLYCQFTMPVKRSYSGNFSGSPVIIDISNETFFLLTFGSAGSLGGLRKHTDLPIATSLPVRLSSVVADRTSDLQLKSANECRGHPCAPGAPEADCRNTIGSYKCTCRWRKCTTICTHVNGRMSCADDCPSECLPETDTCYNPEGRNYCKCPIGFRFFKGACVDNG